MGGNGKGGPQPHSVHRMLYLSSCCYGCSCITGVPICNETSSTQRRHSISHLHISPTHVADI